VSVATEQKNRALLFTQSFSLFFVRWFIFTQPCMSCNVDCSNAPPHHNTAGCVNARCMVGLGLQWLSWHHVPLIETAQPLMRCWWRQRHVAVGRRSDLASSTTADTNRCCLLSDEEARKTAVSYRVTQNIMPQHEKHDIYVRSARIFLLQIFLVYFAHNTSQAV